MAYEVMVGSWVFRVVQVAYEMRVGSWVFRVGRMVQGGL